MAEVWRKRLNALAARPLILVAMLALAAVATAVVFLAYRPSGDPSSPPQSARGGVMLILRGVASADKPTGQLDDASALEYAQRLGYRGEVLDVAGDNSADSPQVKKALERIRGDETVTALYGFSGGGYNARRIWAQLNAAERARIEKIVVVGSPGVGEGDFPGSRDVAIEKDPPAGHMAGPKVLLESVD